MHIKLKAISHLLSLDLKAAQLSFDVWNQWTDSRDVDWNVARANSNITYSPTQLCDYLQHTNMGSSVKKDFLADSYLLYPSGIMIVRLTGVYSTGTFEHLHINSLRAFYFRRGLTLVQATSWDVDRAHCVAAAITRFCWVESLAFWATFLALSTRAAAAFATAFASCINISCSKHKQRDLSPDSIYFCVRKRMCWIT